MKKLMAILVIIVFLLPAVAIAKQVTVNFTWDPNVEPDMAGYAIFQRVEGQEYDYSAPMDPDCTIVDGKCWTDSTIPANLFTHILDVPDGVSTTYYWVARAKDIYANWSGDSNEVTYTFNLAALPAATDLNAVYNKVAQTVDFSWSQVMDDRVTSWKLYQGLVSGGPYTEIMDIPWDGSTTMVSASMDANLLAPGEEYYFVVVAFGDEVNSPDSNEVEIDRRPPTKVIQLKITLQ